MEEAVGRRQKCDSMRIACVDRLVDRVVSVLLPSTRLVQRAKSTIIISLESDGLVFFIDGMAIGVEKRRRVKTH